MNGGEMENILIIDDDPSTTRLLEVLLTREGFNILSENLGEKALATSQNFNPNLIILDLMMPGIDGLQICRALKKDPVLGEVPVIMFSAVNEEILKSQARDAGVNDYITKPIHPDELVSRIRMWLNKKLASQSNK